jgi:hypothetical protein
MSPGNYLVAITSVEFTPTTRNITGASRGLRLIFTLTVTTEFRRSCPMTIDYAPLTYGITMWGHNALNRYDPYWRNFLTAIGHTEETLPKERLILFSPEAIQKILDEVFMGKTGWIYYQPTPPMEEWSPTRIKWLQEAPNVRVE